MPLRDKLVTFCADHPRWIVAGMALLCAVLAAQIPSIHVDTDPENMLSEEEFVRVFHNQVKQEFVLYDMIVLGIVNESHPDGVFTPGTLKKVHDLTREIEKIEGVIANDILAPSTVDDIQQAGLGTVRFEWLMKDPPATREEALRIRDRARENPLHYGTLLSEDGKALCLYIPIQAKTLSYAIASKIRDLIRPLKGEEKFHITGLPVAEDTFGVEMFKQMAVSAPLAGLLIFILMWWFFKNFSLVLSAMLVAMATVICTMGLLIGMGYTVHIMSSMIPIFLMPIAVVDSIHILSEFFDRYQIYKDRRKTLMHVMRELFTPMLYTSLTSAAGFASLALTPNPPVKVFGLFIAFGILLAWIFTITFIPAYVMLLKESSLSAFGLKKNNEARPSMLQRLLQGLASWTYRKYKLILAVSAGVLVLAAVGISTIVVNDNPVKWFEKKHPIRVADRILNEHFGGTYMAYLVLQEKSDPARFQNSLDILRSDLDRWVEDLKAEIPQLEKVKEPAAEWIDRAQEKEQRSFSSLLQDLETAALREMERDTPEAEAWDEISLFFNAQKVAHQPFKNPEVLHTLEALEQTLMDSGAVGKVNSLVDVVKKVHYELMGGDKTFNVIPKTAPAVAQTLLSFQNSHNPDDLWHLVTPDYQKANLWVQLKSGDNKDMEPVLAAVRKFFEDSSVALDYQWAGLTYLNVIWQDKMVTGMMWSLLGSFVIVGLIAAFLFRSPLWGLLCMVPLTVTISFIYGMIGFVGKDYDMPVAVLSAMTLGLSVDFAIHFLQRSRVMYETSNNSWESTSRAMFGEPARAISRNILVIAIGFTPLMVSPLIPYQTVGFLLASIMLISGFATLMILPALMRVFEHRLFLKNG